MKTRDTSLDALCGILIIHMIIGHLFEWSSLTDTNYYLMQQKILFFFMPWFFLKSGMFYREKEIKQNIKTSYKRLIIPLITFTILGLPSYWISLWMNNDTNIIHYLLSPLKSFIIVGNNVANLPLWFLFSLFCVNVISGIIFKYIKTIYVLFVSFGLAAILNNLNTSIPHYIPNILLGVSFYSIGHISQNYNIKKRIYLICIIIYISSIIFFPQYVDVRTNTLRYGNYLLWFVISIISCFAYNYLFKILQKHVPAFIVNIGRNSLIYFTTHWLIISYTILILKLITNINKGWTIWFILLCVNIIILPVCVKVFNNNKLRIIIGQ